MEIYGMTGERLGEIGVKDETAEKKNEARQGEDDLPQWKKDFLSKPSISVRKGIAWGYKPPTEDADVLVLTAPSSKFVDIRFPISKAYDRTKPLSSHAAFWAFSGTAQTAFPASEEGFEMPLSAHCTWKHDIDSQGPGIQDEGDMFLLQNGDSMEVGLMKNPETGEDEMYKEYWTGMPCESAISRDERLEHNHSHEIIGHRDDKGTSHHSWVSCAVAEASSESRDSKGLIVRLGRYCQGVYQTHAGESGLVVERLIWNPGDSIWERDPRSGYSSRAGGGHDSENVPVLPCAWLCSEERALGDNLECEGITWKVSEFVRQGGFVMRI